MTDEYLENKINENNEKISELEKKFDDITHLEVKTVYSKEIKDQITELRDLIKINEKGSNYNDTQINELKEKVKLYEATIVGGDFQWLEITKIKKALRIIADWTLLGKAPKGLDEFMIHKRILEIFEEKETKNFKLIRTVKVTPNRGYRTVWEMSFRIPHKVLIDLLGEPSTEEEGMLYTKTLEGEVRTDKNIDDLTIGHWYVDVDGEPFRIDLINVEKLFQSKIKNFVNPKREEVVYIYGNGFTATMSFLEMIYSRFGELKIGKWGKN